MKNLKKLSHRLAYLREEEKDVSEGIERGKWEINIAVLEVFGRSGKRVPVNEPPRPATVLPEGVEGKIPETEVESASPQGSPACKKIFRKIAAKAHPDKMVGASPELVERMQEIYTSAARANNDNDVESLISIAVDLDIEIELDEEEQYRAMESKANSIEESLRGLKSTLQWHWYTIPRESKISVLANVVMMLGLSVETSILADVISWIDSGFPGGSSYVTDLDPPTRRPPQRQTGTRPEKMQRRR